MNVNSVNSLLPSYLLPFNSTATNGTNANSAASVQPQADVLSLSPASQFLNQLQQLQTQNPPEFQAMLTEITGQLNQAAGTASANGNTPQANQLTALANTFQSASTGGPLPTAQQLQQAGVSGHHHHGSHHGSGSSSSSAYNAFQAANASTQNESLAASIFGSISPIPQQTPQSIWA
jgi:hypothetical protein